jgi:putative PEP-CTERM system TPR-repeat lipoprotein
MPHLSRLHLALLAAVLITAGCGDSATQYLSEAKQLEAKGDDKGAIIQFKNALQKDDKNADARYGLGTLYNRTGNYASAEKELRRARDAGYPADQVNVALATALQGQGAFQRVIEEIIIPDTATPMQRAQLLVARGNAELGLNDADKAAKLFAEAAQLAPKLAAVHLGLARIAITQNAPDKALAEVDIALAQAPTDHDAWLMKGDLLRLTNQPDAALAAYQSAIKNDPRNIPARLSIASIYLAKNKFDDARQQVEAANKLDGGNLSVRYMQGLVAFRSGKLPEARDALQQVLKVAPEHLPSLLLSGAINYAQGSYEQAANQLGKVLEKVPNSAYARKLMAATQAKLGQNSQALATLQALNPEQSSDPQVLALAGDIYLRNKQYVKANQMLEKAATIDPKSAAIRTGLGMSRLASGDSDRALADLETAASLDTGSAHQADTLLIVTLLRDKQFDKALLAIAELNKKQPNNPLAYNFRGGAYVGKKDLVNARKSFEQALTIKPDFFPAAANLAQLDLQDKNPAAARKRFETLLQHDANNSQAMLALAQLSAQAGQEKDYLSWLERAAKAAPDAVQPRLLQADYYLRKNDAAKALVLAREARIANPNNPAVLDMLGNAQLAAGDNDNALVSFQKLTEMAPQSAAAQVRLATAYNTLKQTDNARTALNRALQIQPGFTDAQVALVSLDAKAGRYADAIQATHKIQQQLPQAPLGWILEGDVLMLQKQASLALPKYETAWKLQNSGLLAVKIHQAQMQTDKAAEADARLLSWLNAHPADTESRLYLAQSAMNRNNYALANQNFALLAQKYPTNVLILNNYAYSLQSAKDPRALDYAERALKVAPDNPAVMDTLAGILMTQGKSQRAVQLLQQAQSKAPDNAEIQFHYAQALAQSGDTTRARGELQRLLDSGVAFSKDAEARALLKQLQTAAH